MVFGRLRAHEGVLRRRHALALERLQHAAGQCELAGGGSSSLDGFAEFIKGELSEHFSVDAPGEEEPASWVSRALAGALLLGALTHLLIRVSEYTFEAVSQRLCYAESYCSVPRFAINRFPL